MGRVSDARSRLIAAAIDLIWRHSYGMVGVDAICARAGVKKGSFYYFFKTKDDLVAAALDAHFEGRRPVLDQIFSARTPPLARLQRYFDHVSERQLELRRTSGRVLGCFHASVGSECIRDTPIIAAKVQEILAIYRRYLEIALRDAIASGALAPGDPVARAQTLFSYVEGMLGQARIHDDPSFLQDLGAGAWRLLGVTTPLARPRVRRARSRAAVG